MINRVRISIPPRENGTCPRGSDVKVFLVDDDGTETRLTNVVRAYIHAGNRLEPVTATVMLLNVEVDAVVEVEMEETAEVPEGFLGAARGAGF